MVEIIVENMVKDFFVDGFFKPKKRILNDISFDIKDGENIAIIGPNGCGKTTLLKTLATIYLPDSGKVTFDGKDLKTNLKEIREITSLVSPALNFQNKLTLRDTLKFFGSLMKKDVEDIVPFLDKMQIAHLMDQRLEGFSEGQKAMVRLAIGLIKNPSVLFLDEVVANLDVERKEKVLNFVDKMDRENDMTIVMVDHDPRVVDRLCDKILILNKGGTVYDYSSVDDIIKKMPYKYDINVTFKKPVGEEKIKEIWHDYRSYTQLTRFFAQSKSDVKKITENLLDKDEYVLEYSTSGISLEDIYYLMMEKDLEGKHSDVN